MKKWIQSLFNWFNKPQPKTNPDTYLVKYLDYERSATIEEMVFLCNISRNVTLPDGTIVDRSKIPYPPEHGLTWSNWRDHKRTAIDLLRDRRNQALTKTLDKAIYFDDNDNTPYTIIDRVRYDLDAVVTSDGRYFAEFILNKYEIIIKPWKKFISDAENTTVIGFRTNYQQNDLEWFRRYQR